MANKHHHRGTHQRHSAMVRRAARANPSTICWACGLTLDQHQPHTNGISQGADLDHHGGDAA